jgi:hypothetical protein
MQETEVRGHLGTCLSSIALSGAVWVQERERIDGDFAYN